MTLRHALLTGALALAPFAMLHAQSSGNVAITGTLLPNSCTLATPDTIDYGQVPASSLNQSGPKGLPTRTVTMQITCSGPTLFALRAFDNRHATASSVNADRFGLGLTTSGARIGYYNVMVSGTPSMVRSLDLLTWVPVLAGGDSWDHSPVATDSRYFAFGATGPEPVTSRAVTLTVYTTVQGRNQLQLTGDAAIDGNATMELVYL